ncbi:MAG: glycosyltransferase family 2 protein [Magnetococcus sp. YQC-9]
MSAPQPKPPLMPPPQVTVLTSVYNGARFLNEAVQSILDQSFTNFEFLILDDASTDATPGMLAAWAARDPRIRVVTNEGNLGLTRSLNKGIALARGGWIARHDADDRALPERLQHQLNFLDLHPEVGMLGCAAWFIDAAGVRQPACRPVPTTHTRIAWELLFTNPFFHSAMMVRRALLLDTRYDESIRQAQDFELWGRLIRQTRAANLAKPLIELRRHGERVSERHHHSQQAFGMEIVRRRCQALCPEYSFDDPTLHAVRRLIDSEWPGANDDAGSYLIWLALFGGRWG